MLRGALKSKILRIIILRGDKNYFRVVNFSPLCEPIYYKRLFIIYIQNRNCFIWGKYVRLFQFFLSFLNRLLLNVAASYAIGGSTNTIELEAYSISTALILFLFCPLFSPCSLLFHFFWEIYSWIFFGGSSGFRKTPQS